MNDMNSIIAYVANLKKQGFTPQMAMDMLIQQNPQLQTTMTQMQNMAQGRPMSEVARQLCNQNGIDYDNIMRLF